MASLKDVIFFGAISSFPLYLSLLKESKERMPFQSGLGNCARVKNIYIFNFCNINCIYLKLNKNNVNHYNLSNLGAL